MRSLLGAVLNKAPVDLAPGGSKSSSLLFPSTQRNDAEAQMKAYGSVGTLFGIVSRLANATSQVRWRLYRKSKTGNQQDRQEITSHAALSVWGKPNKWRTTQELVEETQQHVDLTGEGWLVVGRNPTFKTLPLELWNVAPHRIAPIPHATDFIAGYVYQGPNGERVPLDVDDVLQLRMPAPLDPYRGLGPVQTLMTDLDSVRYSANWNKNFFLNSAEPGGVVEVPERLSDDEFDEMTNRWREQHQGVSNAHRVAVLESGAKWVPRAFSMREMQFVELRKASSEGIMEAYGFPKFALGIVEDVNRATANASKAFFAEQLTTPRCERWKGMLNNDFLPLFGATTANLEFDFDSPVPTDEEAARAERQSKAETAQIYVQGLNATRESVKKALELPENLEFEDPPAPAPAPALGAPEPSTDESAQQEARDRIPEARLRDDDRPRRPFPSWERDRPA
jgi:HK97 family phage portal protein